MSRKQKNSRDGDSSNESSYDPINNPNSASFLVEDNVDQNLKEKKRYKENELQQSIDQSRGQQASIDQSLEQQQEDDQDSNQQQMLVDRNRKRSNAKEYTYPDDNTSNRQRQNNNNVSVFLNPGDKQNSISQKFQKDMASSKRDDIELAASSTKQDDDRKADRVHDYKRSHLEHHNHWTEEEWKTLTSYEALDYDVCENTL
mgnify:CR=1 FL=1